MFFNKHDIYCSIIYDDMKVRVLAPPQVQNCFKNNEAFSRTGNNFRREGEDYITETENKHLKNNFPKGVPLFKKWRMTSKS